MTSEDIRALVHKSYAAYDKGDHDFIVNLFDDNIEWKYFSSPEAIPFPNHVRGKPQVLMALKTIAELFEIVGNNLELVMVNGDRAAVICDQKVRQRATGRMIRTKVAAFHRYRDGRLIEYTAFADSLDIMQQTLGRLIDLPEIIRRMFRKMTPSDFKTSVAGDKPPADLTGPVEALWWAAKGDWENAHKIVMDDESAEAAWVHAYLHRVEGDLPNARYWYAQAKRDTASGALEAEWAAITADLLVNN